MKAEARAESYMTEDAEVLLVACNTPARAAKGAVKSLRDMGIKAGLFRPITIWPFPVEQLKAAAARGPGASWWSRRTRAARSRTSCGWP